MAYYCRVDKNWAYFLNKHFFSNYWFEKFRTLQLQCWNRWAWILSFNIWNFAHEKLKKSIPAQSAHLRANIESRVFFDPDFCLLSLFTFLFSSQSKNHFRWIWLAVVFCKFLPEIFTVSDRFNKICQQYQSSSHRHCWADTRKFAEINVA